MENFANKQVLENHYECLKGMGAFIDNRIADQIGVVYDELKSYLEGLCFGGEIKGFILDREARFDYALANLKSMVWQRDMDNRKKNGKTFLDK